MKHLRSLTSPALVLLLLLSVLLLVSCSTEEDRVLKAEQDFNKAYERYRVSDDRVEKADLMDKFVTEFPDSDSAGSAIGMVVYNRYLVNLDQQGALEYLDEKLNIISSPAIRKSVNLQKLEVLAELKRETEFTTLADELLGSPEGLNPRERQQVLGAASASGAWQLAEKVSAMLLDEIQDSDDSYTKSSVFMERGWILHNLDRRDEALEHFSEANSLAPRNFAGYAEYPVMELDFQWATVLLAAGRAEKALEIFEKRALFVKEESPELQDSYQALLENAYLESGKDEASFSSYKAKRKAELLKQVPEFSAPDLNGSTRSFSDIRGEKATMLVFWFPT
jgi:tetratricopeptide (TPR) repeat protein